MGFLLDIEEGKREYYECKTCTRPQPASCDLCPLTMGQQPEIPEWLYFYLGLFKRVKRYNTMPDFGGILDQQERTMKMLDLINDAVDDREKRNKDKHQAAIDAENRKGRS